jgi:hypothetical protein
MQVDWLKETVTYLEAENADLRAELEAQDAAVERAQLIIDVVSPMLKVGDAPTTPAQIIWVFRSYVSRVISTTKLTKKARDAFLQSVDMLDDVVAGRCSSEGLTVEEFVGRNRGEKD